MIDKQNVLLEVEDLKVYFFTDDGIVRAVDGATFQVRRGKTLGIVGESGCGKSVTARAILNIVDSPGKIVGGKVTLHRHKADGNGQIEDIVLSDLHPTGPAIRAIRGKEITMVFQEPMSSFSPVHTVGNQIIEGITIHNKVTHEEARAIAIDTLRLVGMPDPPTNIDRYPHQLSGGMCQRAMIGMALCCRPSLLIADEPTTSVDVTTEAQILDLMRGLQEQLGMAVMYITHNLGVIAQMAEEVCVMYLGKIVERSTVDALFYDPKHPYAKALLRSIPRIGQKMASRLTSIEGDVPDPYVLPKGCTFHPRCPSFMKGLCEVVEPGYYDTGGGHMAACHLYGEGVKRWEDAKR